MSIDTSHNGRARQRAAGGPDQTQAFCGECGVPLVGANFCPSCGAVSANLSVGAASPEELPERLSDLDRPEPATQDASRSRTTMIVSLVAVVVLLVAGAAAALILSSRGQTKSPPVAVADTIPSQALNAFTPVVAANTTLKQAVAALHTGGSSGAARSAITAAQGAVTTANTALAGLTATTSADRAVLTAETSALTSEQAWLTSARAVLHHSSSAQLSQLSSLGLDATTKLTAVDPTVAGAGASFPSTDKLVGYVASEVKTAQTKATTQAFNSSVASLISQSEPAFQQINELFGQLSSAANGDGTDITLAQAEQTITSVVTNRTSLAASARVITASTAAQLGVRTALVTAMDASLADDQAIDSCLNEDNDGDIAFIFQSCLGSTTSYASAANNAKDAFWSAYNNLETSIGQPASERVSF